MSGIQIHPEKGINPHLTYCPRCKGEAQELVLVGANDGIYECDATLASGGPHRMIGRPTPSMRDGDCPECRKRTRWTRVGTLEDHQRLRATQPCDKCQAEIKEHEAIVDAGGVYWHCVDCKNGGVIKAGAPFSKLVRETHQKTENAKHLSGIHPGWYTTPTQNKLNALVYIPCGIEFKKEDCPACGPDKEIHNPSKPKEEGEGS